MRTEVVRLIMMALGYAAQKVSLQQLQEMVRDYQKKKGLTADGIFGQRTHSAANKDLNPFNWQRYEVRPMLWQLNSRLSVNEEVKKTFALHHTAGGPNGSTVPLVFDNNKHVGTSYALGADGTIVQMMIDPFKDWAYHLNINKDFSIGMNAETKAAMESISIEICNWGPLLYDTTNKVFRTYTGAKFDGKVVDYQKLYGENYRGYRYYQAYTDEQLEALSSMLKVIMPKLGYEPIPWTYQGDFVANRKVVQEVLDGKRKLFHHSQVRTTKSDLHPQPELIAVLSTYHLW